MWIVIFSKREQFSQTFTIVSLFATIFVKSTSRNDCNKYGSVSTTKLSSVLLVLGIAVVEKQKSNEIIPSIHRFVDYLYYIDPKSYDTCCSSTRDLACIIERHDNPASMHAVYSVVSLEYPYYEVVIGSMRHDSIRMFAYECYLHQISIGKIRGDIV